MIPKSHVSRREDLNSRCLRFGPIFRRYDSCCRCRSIDRDRCIQQTLTRDTVFAIAFGCFFRV